MSFIPVAAAVIVGLSTFAYLNYLLVDIVYCFDYPLRIKELNGVTKDFAKWKYTVTERLRVGIVGTTLVLVPILAGMAAYVFALGMIAL